MTDPRHRWPSGLGVGLEVRDRLVAAYDADARGYHDLRHLAEVLENVALLCDEDPRDVPRDVVLLAAWFHDAVYEGRGDDEERSAALAEHELTAAGAPIDLVGEVMRLVRLTGTHRPAEDDPAGQVLCDADLAILAAGPERYDEYVAGVRTEYARLPDDEFRRGRAAVLRDLTAGATLFHTEAARSRWERAARANVARELARLDAGWSS